MEAKSVDQPVELPDELLEGVAGGVDLTSAEVDRAARPLYEKGLSGEQVFLTLVDTGFIDPRRTYYVTDSNLEIELTRYLRKLNKQYYPDDEDY